MFGDKQNYPDISSLDIKDDDQPSSSNAGTSSHSTANGKVSLLSSSLAAAAANTSKADTTQSASQPIEVNREAKVPEEPSLYATSEGDTFSGRIVPSSSNISLFSLNNEAMMAEEQRFQVQQQQQPQQYYNPGMSFERKSSVTSLSSQRHHNNLHIQRHQHYIAALTPMTTNPSTPSLRKLSTSNLDFNKTTSPKAIPSRNMVSGSNTSNPPSAPHTPQTADGFSHFPPEPYLEPTSLGGSPSHFYLSSRTPPASLNNASNFHGYFAKQQQQQQPQQQKPIKIQTQQNSFFSDKSPDLMPIGTPNDMPPMTPLLLNNGTLEDYHFTPNQTTTTAESSQRD